MHDAVILAHDIGTSGTKTSLVRADGSIEDSRTSSHETTHARMGWAEQNAEDWWNGVCINTRALVEANPALTGRIAGIGLSGHMLGCLPVDADGCPLRPAMIHSDSRAADQFSLVSERVGDRGVYEKTGNILDPRSPLCKILWVKDNEPERYAQTHRFLQSKDFIVGRLTGSYTTTDYSDASHAQLLDVRARTYATDMLGELGVDVCKLPELHRATDVVGTLTAESAASMGLKPGIPVVAGGGDGSCANVGAGVVSSGEAYCCIGTTAWIACVANEPLIDPGARIFNIMALDGETYGIFGTIQSAGSSLEWAMQLLNEPDFSRFESLVSSTVAGSDGLIYLPYLDGERAPIWDTNARGVYFGIRPTHGRNHFLRATIEGVAFALRSVLEVFRETQAIPSVRIIGGGAQSAIWRDVLANACHASVQTLSAPPGDATSLGAAIAAGVGVGLFSSLAEGVRNIKVTRQTQPDETTAATYDELFEVFAALYPSLESTYALLAEKLKAIAE